MHSLMSKAFTKESDDAPEQSDLPPRAAVLPAGERNLVTPDGARRLREELNRLVQTDRPQAVSAGDDDALPRLDARIEQLEQSLASAAITPPPADAAGRRRAQFGATVTVQGADGAKEVWRIVGVDEADIDRGWISWLSPLAHALLDAKVGQTVRFEVPAGKRALKVLEVAYE